MTVSSSCQQAESDNEAQRFDPPTAEYSDRSRNGAALTRLHPYKAEFTVEQVSCLSLLIIVRERVVLTASHSISQIVMVSIPLASVATDDGQTNRL